MQQLSPVIVTDRYSLSDLRRYWQYFS